MKYFLRSITVCFLFIVSSVHGQPGFTCAEALQISNIPFSVTDNTANYGNGFNPTEWIYCTDMPYGPSAFQGNDVFYAFTATETRLINIKMTPDQPNTVLMIRTSTCNDSGGCLKMVYNNTTNPRIVNNLQIYEGNTYQIMISSAAAVQTSGYTLAITQDCIAPDNAGAYAIKATSATLNWFEVFQSDNAWEVLLIPGDATPETPADDPVVENGTLLFPVNSANSNIVLAANTLTPSTTYHMFVRTVCSNNGKSPWSSPGSFQTAVCDVENQCNYKFIKSSTSVNGWNGGKMLVRQNGITVGELTMTGNVTVNTLIPICNDIPFDVYWSVPGTHPENVGLSIQNPYTDVIYNKLPGEGGNPLETLFTDTGHCSTPTCQKPTALSVSATTQTSATLTWTQAGTSAQWEVYVTSPDGLPPPINAPVTGVAPYYLTNTNAITVSGLAMQTTYKYYVRAVCSPTDKSAWTYNNPKAFSTKPSNDDCVNAINVVQNTLQDCLPENVIHGSTLGATPTVPTLPNMTGSNCSATSSDVWYTFTAVSSSCTVNISTTGTIFGSIFSGNCGNLTKLACFVGTGNTVSGLTVNQVYYLRISGQASSTGGEFDLCLTVPPPNDESTTAIALTVNPDSNCTVTTAGNTLGATASTQTNNCVGVNDDVWYTFVATSPVHVIRISDTVISVGSDTVNHALFSGSGASLSFIYCTTASAKVSTNLIVGNAYTIRVFSSGTGISQSAKFNICVATPIPVTNDECASAMPVVVAENMNCNNTVHGSLAGATTSAVTNNCTSNADDDVWFKFVATTTSVGIRLLNVSGTATNLVHSLFQGSCDNLSAIYCSYSDDSTTDNLTIGQTYYIRVWSSAATVQDIVFDVCVMNVTASLTTSTTLFTPQQLVTNVLINNPCVDISNITYSTGSNFNSVNGIGYFTNLNSVNTGSFPIASGLVLSTGDAAHVGGHNNFTLSEGISTWPGDLELQNAIQMNQQSYNASVLEFDFTTPTAYMSFNFLFASEEYGTFQCNYSDGFAFLLTDLATNVTTNLAVLPDNITPISVVTIRDQQYNPDCDSMNPDFFGHYFPDDDQFVSAINFNGQTHLMTAASDIIPNHPYHIKLAVADRGDRSFDSAVFLQAGSFASGPPECTDKIRLTTFIDENANGIKEDTEIAFNYGSFTYQQNNTGELTHISTPLGTYTLYDSNPSNTYDFSYVIDPEFQTYFSVASTTFNDINVAVGSGTTELFFPINVLQAYNNLAVSILPTGIPRPGFDYSNTVTYTNLGMTSTSGTIAFTRDASTTITGVSQSGIVNTADGFTYSFSNLPPHETRSFVVTMSVPAIPAVNLGDQLTTSAVISAPSGDINIFNNAFSNTQTVVGSYDPNDKQEAHGGKINFNQFSADDYLYYTIRFQNTGTYNALNVRVEDILDGKLDPESIRMVSASHNYVMERIDNKVVWHFDYIQLPSIYQNEALSHGYITFRIKPLPGFELGDIISNTADIHFDANPAITTNTVNTVFEIPLGIGVLDPSQILLFPNPANQYVKVALVNTVEDIADINVIDMLGKSIIVQKNIGSMQTDIDISHLAKGVYLVEIITANHLKQLKKLIVQ
ncbi:choice-of-anchor L domain-containing protein [Flavobacterium sp.]|uniref:DUF7619 domain-containing protein n=1 Tax=Flavobacterium sp. TaxID=239 RepID=UPI00260E19A5|nr:choice-of-anchor L domain-containing protein [Flavobacterium sp.]